MKVVSLRKLAFQYGINQVKETKKRHVMVINNRTSSVYMFDNISDDELEKFTMSPIEGIIELTPKELDDDVFYIGSEYFDEECGAHLIEYLPI